MHTSVFMSFNYTVTTSMCRPFMWPSSGWNKREYNYNYIVSDLSTVKESHKCGINSELKKQHHYYKFKIFEDTEL